MLRFIIMCVALAAFSCGKDEPNEGTTSGDVADMGTSDEDMFVPLDWGDAGPSFDAGPLAETLPLEVVGPPGTELTVELILDELADDAEPSLQLRLANVVEPGTAELVVNGAYTFDLSEADGGFIRPTGGWAEDRIPLDRRQLRVGENYFTFRWLGGPDDISGFRVIDVALDAGAASDALIAWDMPSNWAPDDPTPEAAERGRRYFQNVSAGGGPVCAECHTRTGEDLQYYGYSNRAIAAYAELLGFDAVAAGDVANYVRTLDVGRDGRPWIAPFQPGPNNYGAAGAPVAEVVDDDVVREVWLGPTLPMTLEWDYAAGLDTYRVPATFQAVTWNRWLPRQIDFGWFDRAQGVLDDAIGAYEEDANINTAHALLEAAVTVGYELGFEGEHQSRVDLMKWTAVKLWSWSRAESFYAPHHGFPDTPWGELGEVGSPPYMAEVGFALYDLSGTSAPNAEAARYEALQWWLAQLSVDYGRGRSTGGRPLDYHALLTAAQGVAGPNEIAWFYVLGSWEESRGGLIDAWGSAAGPVRLLPPALPYVSSDLLPVLWRRFVRREADHAIGGGEFSPEHLNLFQRAWSATCGELDQNTREQLVATTPDALRDSLECPP